MNDVAYTGKDNLEVMEEAENYNAWLCDLVIDHAIEGTAILDFGAGSGTYAKVIASHGYHVSCVEPDESLRGVLKDSGLPSSPSIESLPSSSQDFIYTFNVLEHIENHQRAISELSRTLKSGGTLLVYVPAFQVLYSSMDKKVGHYRRYRLKQLIDLINSAGLTVTYSRYADSLGFLASIAYKLIGSSDGTLNPKTIRFYDRWLFPISLILDCAVDRFVGKNALVLAIKK